uniref:Uncharacterized protein n=1 Tax=Cacopsylla melanoneura TaxID=428564 RepID=A0A8D8WH79_9HEMI
MTTMSPTLMFSDLANHLWRSIKVCRYSRAHRFQKCWVTWLRSSQRVRRLAGTSATFGSGRASRGAPIRKCPGVRHCTSSTGQEAGTPIGRELRIASQRQSADRNSS